MKSRKRTPQERRKHLARAIYLTWSSLNSHLDYAIKATPAMLKEGEDEHFHAEAIREYSEVLLICARELEILAPKRTPKKSRRVTSSNTKANTLQDGSEQIGSRSQELPNGLGRGGTPNRSKSTQLSNDKT